jgi:quinolinate synthase
VGDSLDLSRRAADTEAEIIVFAGVHFMAETAKILSPGKKVLIPDQMAGCSLADSCPPDEFASFRKKHPDHMVVTYVNTSAAIKALSDVCCTSTNALQIIQHIPENQKIIFAPDRNLGNYLNSLTGRNMLVWDGACHVHEEFSLEKILLLKNDYPEAKIIAHPECQGPIRVVADFIGSTSALLNFSITDKTRTYIVATESGILHQMKKANPDKLFIPAPPKDSTCACNDCKFMKLNNLKKIYNTLKYEWPEVTVPEDIRVLAEVPIRRMLEWS